MCLKIPQWYFQSTKNKVWRLSHLVCSLPDFHHLPIALCLSMWFGQTTTLFLHTRLKFSTITLGRELNQAEHPPQNPAALTSLGITWRWEKTHPKHELDLISRLVYAEERGVSHSDTHFHSSFLLSAPDTAYCLCSQCCVYPAMINYFLANMNPNKLPFLSCFLPYICSQRRESY